MKKIIGISDLVKGDYMILIHNGLPQHIFTIEFANEHKIVYQLVKMIKKEITDDDWSRVGNFVKVYKLSKSEALAYMV